MVAAIGWGYHCQETHGTETTLKKVHAETADHDPLDLNFPTLFH